MTHLELKKKILKWYCKTDCALGLKECDKYWESKNFKDCGDLDELNKHLDSLITAIASSYVATGKKNKVKWFDARKFLPTDVSGYEDNSHILFRVLICYDYNIGEEPYDPECSIAEFDGGTEKWNRLTPAQVGRITHWAWLPELPERKKKILKWYCKENCALGLKECDKYWESKNFKDCGDLDELNIHLDSLINTIVNSFSRRVRIVSFKGYNFDAERVIAVDPVATHSTGGLSCDWQYGVKLRLEGAEIIILSPKDSAYGQDGSKTTRYDLIKDAEALREELLRVIWPNDDFRSGHKDNKKGE